MSQTSNPPSFKTRTATLEDHPAILRLLASTYRPFVHTWPWESHLGQEVFQVTFSRDQMIGALMAWPDEGPVAWVRLGVLDGEVDVTAWLDQNLPLLQSPLRQLGAQILAWMDVGEWVGPALQKRGFRQLTRLVTMSKEAPWLPIVGVSGVQLRPVEATDIPTLVKIDHAAFSPTWWLSRTTLERLRTQAHCFLVAEREGGCLGYIEARQAEHGAHIDRLVVDPPEQGQGIGALLLANGLSQLWERGVKHVALNTQEENLTSQRLYYRFGFHPIGRRVSVWEREI